MKHPLHYLAVVVFALATLSPCRATGEEAAPPALSLANVYRDDIDLADYWISEKLDGVRTLWDGAAL